MPCLSGLNYSSWVPLILVHSIFLHAQREGRVVILSQPLLHRLSFDTMQFLPHYLLEYLTIHLVDLLDRSPLFRKWHESDDEVGKEVVSLAAVFSIVTQRSSPQQRMCNLEETWVTQASQGDLLGFVSCHEKEADNRDTRIFHRLSRHEI